MNATRVALLHAGPKVMVSDLNGLARTGSELVERVDQLAGALNARGLAGERIGVWYTNSIAAIEAALAVEWLGATRVPVDPTATPAEAAATWRAAGTVAVVGDHAHAGGVTSEVLVHDDVNALAGDPMLPLSDVPLERTLLLYPRAVQSDRLLAVPISYQNWEATMAVNIGLYRDGVYGSGFGADECFLTVQQLMHGTGLVGTFPFLRMGLPQLIIPRFEVDVVLDLLREGAVTSTMMVTAMVTRLATAAARRPGPLGALRRLLYGGAPMPPAILKDASTILEGVLVQVYGRLEGGWPLTVLDQADHRAIVAGNDSLASSCGRPVAQAGELRLQSTGEVCVRSPMVVSDYADKDGWCSLGDTGSLIDGYLHLGGRLDRMINTGYHVYPQEIEDAIKEVPGVIEALVRGEPDEQGVTSVVAHLVRRPGAQDSSLVAAVDSSLRTRFARYKVPRHYKVADRLPTD